MRIVGGDFKGRAIAAPDGRNTRPTSDRAREAIFNILAHAEWAPDMDGARVMDVFARSGALGFEALSRGAAFCLFVETDEAARGAIRQDDLLRFTSKGQLTLLHMADCHAQLKPTYHREPSLNLGVGEARGQLPHLTGTDLLARFGISRGSLQAYMLTAADYEALARAYGRVGGMDRLATLIKAIFPHDQTRRNFIKAVGKSTAMAAIARKASTGPMAR